MCVSSVIDQILNDDLLDIFDKYEHVYELIYRYEWEPIQESLLSMLQNDDQPLANWQCAADLFWSVISDNSKRKHKNRKIEANRVIALLYHRLPPDEHSPENNLAWSIAHTLKGVGYLSDWDPLQDRGVLRELQELENR